MQEQKRNWEYDQKYKNWTQIGRGNWKRNENENMKKNKNKTGMGKGVGRGIEIGT